MENRYRKDKTPRAKNQLVYKVEPAAAGLDFAESLADSRLVFLTHDTSRYQANQNSAAFGMEHGALDLKLQ